MALLDDEDKADIDDALEMYRKYKTIKTGINRAEEDAKQAREIERLKVLKDLPIELLIMEAKDPEQRKMLYALARLQRLGALSPEKIVTLLLEDKPELKEVARDLILGQHDNGKLEQYEKLIKELKETRGEQKEVYERHIQTLKQMFDQALGAARDIATGGLNP